MLPAAVGAGQQVVSLRNTEAPQWGLDGADFGGMVTMDDKFPPEVPPHWLPYFAVEDVDATTATATSAGGTVLMEPTSVPDGPLIAVLPDPQGAAFGVYLAGGRGPRNGQTGQRGDGMRTVTGAV